MAAVPLTDHGGLDKLVYRTGVPVTQPAPGKAMVKIAAAA